MFVPMFSDEPLHPQKESELFVAGCMVSRLPVAFLIQYTNRIGCKLLKHLLSWFGQITTTESAAVLLPSPNNSV